MTDWIDANSYLRFYRYGSSNQFSAYHTGSDINLNAPVWDSDAGKPVWAVADGVVTFAGRVPPPSTWGRLVVIRHEHKGSTAYSRSAHMATMWVSRGDTIKRGQQIGTIGGVEFGLPNHLHFDISTSGILETNPTYWPGNNKQGVIDHFVEPKAFLALNSGVSFPPATRITAVDVSTHQGTIDFKRMMDRGAIACYVRGSIGGTGTDGRFVTNWNAVGQTPIKRGIYHLFRSDSTADQNLANIIRLVNQHGAGDLRIAIDVEPVTGLQTINGDRVKQLIALFKEAFGFSPLIYTGNWIKPHVTGDTSWFRTSLLWLAEYWSAPPPVGLYPDLPDGAPFANLLMHQWTSSYYIESEWGVSSSGLDINVIYDLGRLLIDAKEPPPPPPPPPPKVTVDLLGYMMPSQARGPLFELRREDGSQERVQAMAEGNVFYYVKGSGGIDGAGEWEELTFDADYIYRGKDTSPRPGEWYALRDDIGAKWSKWAPRRMGVGDSYLRNPWVVFFKKSDCSEVSRGQQRTTITLEAVHAHWTSPHGITLKDVIAVVVRHADGSLFERTFFAKGYGLVGFEGETVKGYVSELHEPGQRPDQQRETGCFS